MKPIRIIYFLGLLLMISNVLGQSQFLGLTATGGANTKGALFSVSSDGTGLTVKGDFTTDISTPVGGLVQASNGKFYGASAYGGTSDAGTVFEYDPTLGTLTKKLDLSTIGGVSPSGSLLQASNGKLYGVAVGNTSLTPRNYGILYEFDPSTGIGTKKFTFQTLINGNPSGTAPSGAMIQAANGKLYGITVRGGQYVDGSLFEFDIITNTYTQRHSFGTTDPTYYLPQLPSGDLFLASDNKIYGTTGSGSTSGTSEYVTGDGVIFSYTPGSNRVMYVYDFKDATTSSGRWPTSGVIQASNGKLYGTARGGGVNDNGVLFEYDITTSTYTKKADFSSATTGASPGRLTESPNGKLYGMTTSGGVNGKGTLFEYDPATGILSKILDFDVTNGSAPSNIFAPGNILLSVTSGKQDQTISFSALPTKYVGNSAFLLDATSSSGLPIFYASSDPTVASISGSTVTILKEGTITITASQVGNSGYNAAPEVQQTLAVLRTNQTITFPSISTATYGGAAIQLNATSTSGLAITYATADPNIASISGTKVVLHDAGTTTITARQAGNGTYYAAADAQQTITINKAQQTISFSALAYKGINDAPFDLSAVASSTLPVVFSSASDKISITDKTVTLLKAGRASIAASQPGNANYEAAAVVEQSFCIKPARPELSLSSSSGVATLTSNASIGNQWYFNGTLINGQSDQALTLTATGIYKVKVKIDDCESEFSAEISFVLPKSEQSIQFNTISDKAINDQPFFVNATATSGASVIFSSASDKISLAANQVTILKAGRASITASQPGNSNYLAATPVSQSFCIKPAAAQVSISTTNGLTILTSNVVNGNQWYFNGNVISGQTAQTLLITQSGIYKVNVTVDDCASDFSSDTNAVITALEDYSTSSIALFPNPASDAITLSFGNVPGKKSVSVFQLDGKVKLTKEYWSNEGVLNIADYSPGIYFIKVISSNSNAVLKFVKK